MTETEVHSEDVIGDHRYAWWNSDYVSLLADRVGLRDVTSVLDVGVGAAHWTATLLRHLKRPVKVCGVDFEQQWVDEARKTLAQLAIKHDVQTILADAHDLPLPDNSFDLVTCQTLLMHCRDPERVLREMLRVARPGASFLLVEPTNILNGMQIFDAILSASPENQARIYLLWAHYHKGLRQETGADHNIAPRLPQMLAACGFEDIAVYQNDRVLLVDDTSALEEVAKVCEGAAFRKGSVVGGATAEVIDLGLAAFRSVMQNIRDKKDMFPKKRACPLNTYAFTARKSATS